MPYIGKEPVRGQNRELDDISGSFNGGNTAFTMQVGGINTTAGSVNQLFISVGGVMQNPGTDFTVASSTLTFTTAPASGLDFWGLIQGDAVDINTPADSSVTSAKIVDGAIVNADINASAAIAGSKLADNAIGLAQMASGTDGNLITYDASGDPAHVATGSSGQVLTSNGAGAAPTFQTSTSAGSFRNLIINGAMQVAQRATSSTTAGYGSLDRFQGVSGGGEEACTHSQHALTSSDTGPWAAGFRNSFHLQNGNQTGGAGSNDYAYIGYTIEAQDIATSGWDYNSASSYLTLSFWVKSSVAGQQYGYLYTADGTSQGFSFSVGNLSADTWSKVTVNIPGHANLTFDNDNGGGLYMYWGPHWGSDYTNSGNTLLTWAAYSSSNRTPDFPTTWWTTNDATFEITGVQLELGDTATDFEHKTYADELRRCQRYFWMYADGGQVTSSSVADGRFLSGAEVDFMVTFPTTMRTTPSIYQVTGGDYFKIMASGYTGYCDSTWTLQYAHRNGTSHYQGPDTSGSTNLPVQVIINNSSARLGYQAEL